MARIAGVELPNNKRVDIALATIYGVGRRNALDVCAATGVNPSKRAHELTTDEVGKLREYIDKHIRVEGDLRKEVAQNIRRLIDIGAYRGARHRAGLPVRGQRTHTNARTRKGKARPIAGKKKVTK